MTKAVEARQQWNLQDLKVGMLNATPIIDNELGHQFWIGKVLDVVMHDNQNQIQSIRSSTHNLNHAIRFQMKKMLL